MFSLQQCSTDGCHHYAYTNSPHCYYHAVDKERILGEVRQLLLLEETINDLSISEGHFTGLTLPATRITGSNLAWCTFTDVDFSSSVMTNCFFDFCLFERCRFNGVDVRYSVFAGSRFCDCDLSDSRYIHSNFSGITAHRTNFSSCDFYYSTFITATLIDSSFEDCNLKKTDLRNTERRGVSFRYSNWQEAHR